VRALVGSLVLLFLLQGLALGAQEPGALERAHKHYESGVALFEAGNKEQALVEFQLANEIAPKKENVFMIAQCEYHLGQLVPARTHYQAYLAEEKQGELADLSRLRVEAINRRPGVFAINTVPDNVEVRIEGEGTAIAGQAPNEFRVPRGHYHVTASKTNFSSETRELSIEVAETKPLFFKLEPIPAHLTVRTTPPGATLFVRGNRTQNPYVQDVPPGNYEIYAEAAYYQPKRETITLSPGEDRVVEFPLTYVQRSGRPELIGFWTGIGAVGGGLAVLTQGSPRDLRPSLSLSLFGAGMLAGVLGLGVLSSTTPLVPNYIRDNLALFRIGAMWVGDVEGATLAMGLSQSWTATWLGGAAGLTAGAFAGWWLDDRSPNYGRVSLIQSSAVLGTVAGAISISAIGQYPATVATPPAKDDNGNPLPPNDPRVIAYNNYRNQIKQRMAWGMLAGLNVGLAAGLAMAYLPDQNVYGPSWQRVIMIDLAGFAGAIFATTIELCSRTTTDHCADTSATLNSRTARFSLVGAGLGLVAGWMLTMNYDRPRDTRPELPPLSFIPLPGAVPVESMTGTPELLPGLLSQGRF
jgi:PEGA domain